jgi:organic radical activating enzyme
MHKNEKIEYPYVEFYLTHSCNLSCSNCNRFNNFNIHGRTDWAKNVTIYEEWSRYIDFKLIGIIGGELLLHPELADICTDIRKFWPNAEIMLVTNGLIFENLKNINVVNSIIQNNINLRISIHDTKFVSSVYKGIEKCFGKLKIKSQQNDPLFSTKGKTSSGVKIELWKFTHFHSVALKKNNNHYILHDSDGAKAHHICDMKHCHEFYDGQLYKCGMVLTLPNLYDSKKIHIEINDSDVELLKSYRPLTIENIKNNSEFSVEHLQNVIPQCKFCPEKYENSLIFQEK